MSRIPPAIPIPPRTPTPPPGEESYETFDTLTPMRSQFDPNSLAPVTNGSSYSMKDMSGLYPELRSPAWSETTRSEEGSDKFVSAQASPMIGAPASNSPRQPFNFQPMVASKAPVNAAKPNQRRGHRYKHSSISISHQIFQEPPPRAPLTVPASLPVPTLGEWWNSVSPEQKTRLVWSLVHLAVAAYTWWSAAGSLAITALSHLLLFDGAGALLCVCVDALGNFEVWKRSTLRHPFGLGRAEVLAGFAMSVFLLFMGMDIMSHTAQHLLENWTEADHPEGDTPHTAHAGVHADHARVSPGSVDIAALLAIITTCISAYALQNHARIGRAMRFSALERLPSILSNPAHFFTLSCSFVLLLLPLLSVTMYSWLDRALALTMSLCMIGVGVRMVKVLGGMLLMSYNGDGVAELVAEIAEDPAVVSVEEARFWQVHHGLCMANIKLIVRGSAVTGGESRLRERITRLVKERLGGAHGKQGDTLKWEVTIGIDSDGY